MAESVIWGVAGRGSWASPFFERCQVRKFIEIFSHSRALTYVWAPNRLSQALFVYFQKRLPRPPAELARLVARSFRSLDVEFSYRPGRLHITFISPKNMIYGRCHARESFLTKFSTFPKKYFDFSVTLSILGKFLATPTKRFWQNLTTSVRKCLSKFSKLPTKYFYVFLAMPSSTCILLEI